MTFPHPYRILTTTMSKGGAEMIKTVGIVSLSSGVLGEELVRHELEIGHALPRAIIPFGVEAVVDVKKQRISF